MTSTNIPQTQNREWGFFGTINHHADPERAWDIAFAILHCTGGNVLIALTALILALALTGTENWPREGFRRVAACAIPGGLAYTVWSEHLNTVIRQAWTYTDAMPIVPGLGTELAPAAQWVIVPMLALWAARGRPLRLPRAGKAFFSNWRRGRPRV